MVLGAALTEPGPLLLSLLETGLSQVIFFPFSELATTLPVSNYSLEAASEKKT